MFVFFFTRVLISHITLFSLYIYCLFLCFSSKLDARHHLCSILHFHLLMDVYFVTVHGTSLLAADFTGSVRSNFGWIVRPLVVSQDDLPRLHLVVQLTVASRQMVALNVLETIQQQLLQDPMGIQPSPSCLLTCCC